MLTRTLARVVANPARLAPPFGGLYTSVGLTDGWTASNSTIVTGKVVGPDGARSAAVMTEDAATATTHKMYRQVTASILAQPTTLTVYVKRLVGRRHAQLQINSSGFAHAVVVVVDMDSLVAVPTMAGSYASAACRTGTVGTWVKVETTVTPVVDTSVWLQCAALVATNTESYDGDAVSSLAWWGMDLR